MDKKSYAGGGAGIAFIIFLLALGFGLGCWLFSLLAGA
jgi:hypothetical protein